MTPVLTHSGPTTKTGRDFAPDPQAGEEQGDEIFYTDKGGWRDHEYVSLGVDHLPVLAGRTPIQACLLC